MRCYYGLLLASQSALPISSPALSTEAAVEEPGKAVCNRGLGACSFRQACGARPVSRLKTRQKCDWSQNPCISAISLKESAEYCMCCLAASTRTAATYVNGVVPVVCLNACEKWLTLKSSSEASSRVRMQWWRWSFINSSIRVTCHRANPPLFLRCEVPLGLPTASKAIAWFK